MDLSLPHGAVIDDQNQLITVNLGRIQLSFSFEEWEEFIGMISDIDTVVQSNVTAEGYTCPSCGTQKVFYDYQQPDEDEYN